MHRTQIQLDDWQYQRLKASADRQGRSLASLVREAVAGYLAAGAAGEPTRSGGLAAIEGIAELPGESGRDHDAVLYGPDPERA